MVSPFHIVLALGQQEQQMNAKVHLSSRQASNIKDMYLGACSTGSQKITRQSIVYGEFYGKFTDNPAHAQSVCTRPFLLPSKKGPGDKASP